MLKIEVRLLLSVTVTVAWHYVHVSRVQTEKLAQRYLSS